MVLGNMVVVSKPRDMQTRPRTQFEEIATSPEESAAERRWCAHNRNLCEGRGCELGCW